MTKKSSENKILANGNNSYKRRSNATKVKLDLYYVKTNSYTKFQVNITNMGVKSPEKAITQYKVGHIYKPKEQPRINMTYDPVEYQKLSAS